MTGARAGLLTAGDPVAVHDDDRARRLYPGYAGHTYPFVEVQQWGKYLWLALDAPHPKGWPLRVLPQDADPQEV